MAKGKLKLRWRKDVTMKGRFYKASPFDITEMHADGFFVAKLWEQKECLTLYMGRSLSSAKRACEKLASRILGAMK